MVGFWNMTLLRNSAIKLQGTPQDGKKKGGARRNIRNHHVVVWSGSAADLSYALARPLPIGNTGTKYYDSCFKFDNMEEEVGR